VQGKIFAKYAKFKQYFSIIFQILVIFPIFVVKLGHKIPHLITMMLFITNIAQNTDNFFWSDSHPNPG